jgi:hypothetical protein
LLLTIWQLAVSNQEKKWLVHAIAYMQNMYHNTITPIALCVSQKHAQINATVGCQNTTINHVYVMYHNTTQKNAANMSKSAMKCQELNMYRSKYVKRNAVMYHSTSTSAHKPVVKCQLHKVLLWAADAQLVAAQLVVAQCATNYLHRPLRDGLSPPWCTVPP